MIKKFITPIEHTASLVEHLGSNKYYIRHIFKALREHRELLEQPDYRRLYHEAQDYLFRVFPWNKDFSKENREKTYRALEIAADIENKHSTRDIKFSIEEVGLFLAERRKIWCS